MIGWQTLAHSPAEIDRRQMHMVIGSPGSRPGGRCRVEARDTKFDGRINYDTKDQSANGTPDTRSNHALKLSQVRSPDSAGCGACVPIGMPFVHTLPRREPAEPAYWNTR